MDFNKVIDCITTTIVFTAMYVIGAKIAIHGFVGAFYSFLTEKDEKYKSHWIIFMSLFVIFYLAVIITVVLCCNSLNNKLCYIAITIATIWFILDVKRQLTSNH